MGYADMDLNDLVKASLRKDSRLAGQKIDVSVRNGIVRLRGRVSPSVRRQALKLAREVQSVAAVVDEMDAG